MMVLKFLDYLDEKGVWRNGIDNRPAHMDSFNTIMDFETFNKAMQELPSEFTNKVLREVIDYELVQGIPMSGLLALRLKRHLGLI